MDRRGEEKVKLGYGKSWVHMSLLEDCQVIMPEELLPAGVQEIDRALDDPFGTYLSDLKGARNAAVLVSDITRSSPSHLLLPPLIEKLKGLGVKDVKVIFGLGTHRRMTPDEEKTLLKDCISLPHLQHDSKRCVPLGTTSRGTPVEILEEVASKDLIIATGNIEYHYYAGYSGGAKALLPGVSSNASVEKNHQLMRDPNARTGRLDSPVRLDMEEAARIAGLDFILNVVLNSRKEIVKAVAGDFIQAHRVGAAAVDSMYKKYVKPSEIVITCAGGRPKDINLFQAQKALDNARNAAVPGGSIILLAECAEGLGHPVFQRWLQEAQGPQDCIKRFGREYEFGGHKAAFIAKESLEHDIILVSSMPKEVAEMSFFRPAENLEKALSMARQAQGKDAHLTVIPHGDLTLVAQKA